MLRVIQKQQWKIILLSSLGGMLDIYDFVIFAIYAKVIGATFFPRNNPLLEVIAAFGDKYGRKHTFILSITLMGLATIVMGIMPGYEQLGLAMPLLFLGFGEALQ